MFSVKILLDSINNGNRITTWELTYPRFIHSELLTHRVLSKNSASSRAIPSATFIKRIMDDPVIPIHWGKNQKGMQADEEIDGNLQFWAENEWIKARNNAVKSAEVLLEMGIHKQIVNRLMEPFMWITIIMTATDHGNFYNLRDHKDAEPHIHHLARTMVETHQASIPQELRKGDWHIPLCNFPGDDKLITIDKLKVATGRCARVSYLTHDGKRDIQADIDLCDRLRASGHWSPFEHCARAKGNNEYYGNFQGWRQFRKYFRNENRKEYVYQNS